MGDVPSRSASAIPVAALLLAAALARSAAASCGDTAAVLKAGLHDSRMRPS